MINRHETEKLNFQQEIQKMEEEYEAIFDSNVKELEKYEKHLEVGIEKAKEIKSSILEFQEEIIVIEGKMKNLLNQRNGPVF